MRVGPRIRVPRLRAPCVVAAALMVAAVSGMLAVNAGQAPSPAHASAKAPVATASALFEQRCARCHDADGTGSGLRGNLPALPNFANMHWQQQRSDVQLVVSILEGKGTQMPPFADRLTRANARSLVRHIRTLAPQEMVGVPAAETHDLDVRFRELQEQFERLRKQFYDLRK